MLNLPMMLELQGQVLRLFFRNYFNSSSLGIIGGIDDWLNCFYNVDTLGGSYASRYQKVG